MTVLEGFPRFGAVRRASVSERQVSKTCAAGLDDAQLVRFYVRYGALVRRWAERIFRDGSTADDVLNELAMRLMKRGAVFRALDNEALRRSWLYRATFRLCLDFKAKAAREVRRVKAASQLREESRECAVEERNLLESLMSQLDAEERVIAVLFFEEGHSKVEVHRITSRSRPFIDKKLRRIAKVMRTTDDGHTT